MFCSPTPQLMKRCPMTSRIGSNALKPRSPVKNTASVLAPYGRKASRKASRMAVQVETRGDVVRLGQRQIMRFEPTLKPSDPLTLYSSKDDGPRAHPARWFQSREDRSGIVTVDGFDIPLKGCKTLAEVFQGGDLMGGAEPLQPI